MEYDYKAEAARRKMLMEELGKKIRIARLEAGLSQMQVGVSLGLTDKTISGYEAGRISPPFDKLLMIADLFKKPITYFLGADPKEYKVASRLRAVEVALREIRKQLNEIRLISQNSNLDDR
jgi:transcriptional regulator with XRE-family HTH domain